MSTARLVLLALVAWVVLPVLKALFGPALRELWLMVTDDWKIRRWRRRILSRRKVLQKVVVTDCQMRTLANQSVRRYWWLGLCWVITGTVLFLITVHHHAGALPWFAHWVVDPAFVLVGVLDCWVDLWRPRCRMCGVWLRYRWGRTVRKPESLPNSSREHLGLCCSCAGHPSKSLYPVVFEESTGSAVEKVPKPGTSE